jgi:hypothetical protein
MTGRENTPETLRVILQAFAGTITPTTDDPDWNECVQRLHRGDDRARLQFVRDHDLTAEQRAFLADVVAGKVKRGDKRRHVGKAERLAAAFARAQFIDPEADDNELIRRIIKSRYDFDTGARMLRRYWKQYGRRQAKITPNLVLERELHRKFGGSLFHDW